MFPARPSCFTPAVRASSRVIRPLLFSVNPPSELESGRRSDERTARNANSAVTVLLAPASVVCMAAGVLGCTIYSRTITSQPPGATVYAGATAGQMSVTSGQRTPAVLKDVLWFPWCFKVAKDARGWMRPSDHVPVTATLDV